MSIRFAIIVAVGVFTLGFDALAEDTDADGVLDSADNCLIEPNTGQEDADADGYGNACDADLDNNGYVDGQDFLLFGDCQNRPGQGARDDCLIADFNSDHRVNSLDFMLFEMMWGMPPGPSGTL
jgi:hypothetical protein